MKNKGCTCIYLKHWNTGDNVTIVKFCDMHRPMKSLRGRDLKNSDR